MKKHQNLIVAGIRISGLMLLMVPMTESTADIGNGTSPGQTAAAVAMNQFCANLGFASLACDVLGSPLQLQQLSPQSAMQSESLAITSPYQFIRGVNGHAQKRSDCEGKDEKHRRRECENWDSGGNSAFGFIGPLGVSISGGGGFGDRETSENQTGFNIDTRQANLIIDYAFMPNLIGGFAFNYVGADRTLGLNSGTLNSDSYRFSPFITYRPTPNSYITAMGGYARVDFDSTRRVTPLGNHILTDAKASYGANEYFASLGAGYTWRIASWSIRAYGRGDYNHMTIGGFHESGGKDVDNSAYTVSTSGQSMLSVTSTLGAELSYVVGTTLFPAVFVPKLYAEWVHEFQNGARQVPTAFHANNLTPQASSIAVEGSERNWANLGFGVQMIFPRAIVGFVNYETLFIENGANQQVTGGIRLSF
ncbi:MAG: autotransporter outer membrane beta-barrel domain-containing protein [Gammaproteobacteria bacterium]